MGTTQWVSSVDVLHLEGALESVEILINSSSKSPLASTKILRISRNGTIFQDKA